MPNKSHNHRKKQPSTKRNQDNVDDNVPDIIKILKVLHVHIPSHCVQYRHLIFRIRWHTYTIHVREGWIYKKLVWYICHIGMVRWVRNMVKVRCCWWRCFSIRRCFIMVVSTIHVLGRSASCNDLVYAAMNVSVVVLSRAFVYAYCAG